MKTKMGTLHSDIPSLSRQTSTHPSNRKTGGKPKIQLYLLCTHYFLPRISTGFCFVLLLTKQLGPTKIQNYDIKNLGLKQLSKLNDFLFVFFFISASFDVFLTNISVSKYSVVV